MAAKTQTRERKTGRYSYDNRFDRICARCGLALGQHTAEAPHIVDDTIGGVPRECSGFKPARRAQVPSTDGGHKI